MGRAGILKKVAIIFILSVAVGHGQYLVIPTRTPTNSAPIAADINQLMKNITFLLSSISNLGLSNNTAVLTNGSRAMASNLNGGGRALTNWNAAYLSNVLALAGKPVTNFNTTNIVSNANELATLAAVYIGLARLSNVLANMIGIPSQLSNAYLRITNGDIFTVDSVDLDLTSTTANVNIYADQEITISASNNLNLHTTSLMSLTSDSGTVIIDGNVTVVPTNSLNVTEINADILSAKDNNRIRFKNDPVSFDTNIIVQGQLQLSNGGYATNFPPGSFSNAPVIKFQVDTASNALLLAASNVSLYEISLASIDDLVDVSTPSPSSGDHLVWGGASWISAPPQVVVGGASTFFLDPAVTVGGGNFKISPSPNVTNTVTNTAVASPGSSPAFIGRFLSDPIGRTNISAGIWTLTFYSIWQTTDGSNFIKFRANRRMVKTNRTGTWIGSGPARTFVTSSPAFTAGDASSNRLVAGLVETSNQTGWISNFVSSTNVTVYLSDPNYTNETNVALTAIYYYLFDGSTEDVEDSNTVIGTVVSLAEPAFIGFETNSGIVLALFVTSTATNTASIIFGGTEHVSRFESPILTTHDGLDGLNAGDYQHLTRSEKGHFSTIESNIGPITNILAQSNALFSLITNITNIYNYDGITSPTNTNATISTTYVLIHPAMSNIVTIAGSYDVDFHCSFFGGNANDIGLFSVFTNGVQVPGSEVMAGDQDVLPVATFCGFTIPANTRVEIYYRAAGADTISAVNPRMRIRPVH